ncbi:MAG: hypothetical protein LBF38_01840 [Deltaproteobacteria bacterium]|nr:hypothetical protein [Deltaproteobacteria bacterium]
MNGNIKKQNVVVTVSVVALVLFVLFLLLFLVPRLKSKKGAYGDQVDESVDSISSVGFAGLYELLTKAGGPEVKRYPFSDIAQAQDGLILVSGPEVMALGAFATKASPGSGQTGESEESRQSEGSGQTLEPREPTALGEQKGANQGANQGTTPGTAAPEATPEATSGATPEAASGPAEPAQKKYAALVFSSKWNYVEHPSQTGWTAEQTLKSNRVLSVEAEYVFSNHNQKGEESQKEVKEDVYKAEFIRLNWPSEDKFYSIWDLPSPTGQNQIQLLRFNDKFEFDTVVGTAKGALVVRYENDDLILYFVADPDVANNMGLGRGNNADFMMGLIKNIYEKEGLTGDLAFFNLQMSDLMVGQEFNSFFGPLLKYPLYIITILTLLTALLFFAALGKRFGGIGHLAEEVGFGKSKLIDNSAKLMARPNLLPYALAAYQKMTVQWAEKTFHVPKQSNLDSYRWIDKVASAKGLKTSLTSIVAMGQRARKQKSHEAMIDCALKLYKFRKELESGSSHLGPSGQ